MNPLNAAAATANAAAVTAAPAAAHTVLWP